jgi:hypothetical protein
MTPINETPQFYPEITTLSRDNEFSRQCLAFSIHISVAQSPESRPFIHSVASLRYDSLTGLQLLKN